MEKIRVMTVFGTRPEAIKMAPLVHELKKHPEFESLCCVTAQHREMLDSVLDIFGIKPDFDLDIMEPRQTLSTITSKTILGMEKVIEKASPRLILVHGDTSTTFAGALAAFYSRVDIGHVEAGLRTYDKYSPFPEEMNRAMVGRLADLNFAPTISNAENLKKEAVPGKIFITGNTVIDAMKYTVKDGYKFTEPTLNALDFENRRVIVVTAHRRENYGEGLKNIMEALKFIAEKYDGVDIVYPVHLSPVVREAAFKTLSGMRNVYLIEPLTVDEMHNLMAKCYMVMTDSGGLQEEAPSLGKPVLVMRNETERPEAVKAGTVKVIGVKRNDIIENAEELLCSSESYCRMSKAVNPYGDGQACRRIAQAIKWNYGLADKAPEDFI